VFEHVAHLQSEHAELSEFALAVLYARHQCKHAASQSEQAALANCSIAVAKTFSFAENEAEPILVRLFLLRELN